MHNTATHIRINKKIFMLLIEVQIVPLTSDSYMHMYILQCVVATLYVLGILTRENYPSSSSISK